METTDLLPDCSQSYSPNMTFRDGLKAPSGRRECRHQASGARSVGREQWPGPLSGQRLGTGTMCSKPKASACTLHRRQVLSRRVGSRLALTLSVMGYFDLNFQHFSKAPLLPAPQQVGGSRAKMVCPGFPKPWGKQPE